MLEATWKTERQEAPAEVGSRQHTRRLGRGSVPVILSLLSQHPGLAFAGGSSRALPTSFLSNFLGPRAECCSPNYVHVLIPQDL